MLGILSAALVFGIGLCAWTGITQKWIQLPGTPLFVCGGSSAFLGFLGLILGVAGLLGSKHSKVTAILGLILGLTGICLFFGTMSLVGGGG